MNETAKLIEEDKKRQREYITFLLGADNFEICHFIRNLAKEHGEIDRVYDDCDCIAGKFNKYDERNYDTMSEYESFEHFLRDYDKEIRAFFLECKDFEIVKE